MGVRLNQNLKKNTQYYIRFFVSPADGQSLCFSDAIGLAFSDSFYQKVVEFGVEFVPDLVPAIENPEGNILNDTLNWTKISGCYNAKGGEEYAILGSFKPSSETYSSACFGVTGSYKFIDDVGVYEFDPLSDTLLLCPGETAQIGGAFLDGNYQWNTGATDSTIVVDKGGRYILSVAMDNCLLSDTVTVIEPDQLLDGLLSDTLICRGDAFRFEIPMPGTYEWSTGEKGNSITVDEGGFYSVDIHNECGDYYHSLTVEDHVCACDVYVPNAFSPNGDGINDELVCFVGCDYPYRTGKFQVFNRWGELVYSDDSGQDGNIRWDGSFRGRPLDAGVYAWVLEYEYIKHGKARQEALSGTITLVR